MKKSKSVVENQYMQNINNLASLDPEMDCLGVSNMFSNSSNIPQVEDKSTPNNKNNNQDFNSKQNTMF